MHRLTLVFATLLLSTPAGAIECDQWTQVAPTGKAQTIEGLIESRLGSDEARSYTSANPVRIRACLQPRVAAIVAEFDGACAEGLSASMNALDEIFDQYFRSCIQ
jgi:hypothetical protein